MVNRFDSRPIVTYHYRDFPLGDLVEAKGDQVVSVCIPAHDEADTVGAVVSKLRLHLMERVPLIDELLVIDDHSSDGTAQVAADAGARVVLAAEVLPQVAGGNGKGEALWRSVYSAKGDIVAWCDADITDFGARFVVGLLGPLLLRPDIAFVKGYYERPMATGDTGGRTTELMARPLLATLFPHLASIRQPLSGEYAGRRAVLIMGSVPAGMAALRPIQSGMAGMERINSITRWIMLSAVIVPLITVASPVPGPVSSKSWRPTSVLPETMSLLRLALMLSLRKMPVPMPKTRFRRRTPVEISR